MQIGILCLTKRKIKQTKPIFLAFIQNVLENL